MNMSMVFHLAMTLASSDLKNMFTPSSCPASSSTKRSTCTGGSAFDALIALISFLMDL